MLLCRHWRDDKLFEVLVVILEPLDKGPAWNTPRIENEALTWVAVAAGAAGMAVRICTSEAPGNLGPSSSPLGMGGSGRSNQESKSV
jgi:hypothetical protein